MKKLLFSMIAMATMLFATSCQNDETLATNENPASVSFTVSLPEVATRAGEGTTATKLHYAVYETDAQGNWGEMLIKREAAISNRAANVSIELATSKKYGFIFWAEAEGAPYSIDWENKAMALNDTQVANNEAMDAFYSAFQYDVEKAFTQEVKLTRPFAQLNIGTNDYANAATAGVVPTKTQVIVKGAYTTMNLTDGTVDDAKDVTYTMNAKPADGEEFPVAGYEYLSFNYILVGEREVFDVEFDYTDEAEYDYDAQSYTSVPLQRNYRTNIYGKLLTNTGDFDVEINPGFDDNNNQPTPWDGNTIVEPEATETEYLIASPAQWAWLKGKNLGGKNIKLTANLDFGGHEVKGIGFAGEFDGQGHTMSNMTLVCGGSYYSNGLFQGDASTSGDVTVKNVTIENVVAECSNPNQGYVGVIFGDIQNINVTLENVHVVNADLCGVQGVGGLVGFVASSRTLTVKDCSVADSYIHNYAVADESGFVNGFAGKVVGTVKFEGNNSISGTTVDGLYAPRRGEATIGLIAAPYSSTSGTIEGASTVDTSNGNTLKKACLVVTAEDIAAMLTADVENISVKLNSDIDLPITSLGQQTGGSGEYKLGGESTESINIDLGGHKLNITTGYWSVLGCKSADATFTIKNGKMTSSQASGTWNSYDLSFANCNYVIDGVTFEKSVALCNAGKSTKMTDVTINEAHDYYALWIEATGQNIEIDGLTINSGRGIKIDKQYVDSPSKVTLSVTDATFTTSNKAAIMVNSPAGADIVLSNIDITNVAADNVNAVWVDEDAAADANLVTVTGGSVVVENHVAIIGSTWYKTFDAALEAAQDGDEIFLKEGEYELSGATAKNITIKGESKENVKLNLAKSIYWTGKSLTLEDLTYTVPTGLTYNEHQFSFIHHIESFTMNNCNSTGRLRLNLSSTGVANIKDCSFTVTTSNGFDGYAIYYYGATGSKVNVKNSTFTTKGKGIVMYSESAKVFNMLVEGCEFVSENNTTDKAAIQMHTELGISGTLTINNTTATGFADVNDGLWNELNNGTGVATDKFDITVDGEQVH